MTTTTTPRPITPGPLSQIRPGETRIYFAVPTDYTIGETFASYAEAERAARATIKTFDYGGCSRAFVDARIADGTGDRILHRVEVFMAEWAYQTGSKTQASHAYRVGCEPDSLPLCGSGTIRRCVTLESAGGRKTYPVTRCKTCAKIVGA